MADISIWGNFNVAVKRLNICFSQSASTMALVRFNISGLQAMQWKSDNTNCN